MSKCANEQMCECANVKMSKCANMQMSKWYVILSGVEGDFQEL